MNNNKLLAIVIALFISGIVILNYDQETINEAARKYDIFATTDSLSAELLQDQFDYFVSKNRKSYETFGEYQKRYQTFTENFKFIETHNKDSDVKGFTLAINKFGDLTDDEFADKYLGSKVPLENMGQISYKKQQNSNPFEQMIKETATEQAIKDLQIPGSIDWRAKGAVTPVGDQGECGSCWAFSAIAAIEGANYIANKVGDELSEQQLIDCADERFGNNGCQGGFVHGAFQYAMKQDLCIEEDYPYTGKDEKCTDWWSCSTKNILTGYKNVTAGSRVELFSAIAKGPVSIGVDAGSKEFRFYSSGIFSEGCDENVNHGVAAVGYSYESFLFFWRNNYITIKNSWSADWGEKGFMRLSANNEEGNGICGSFLFSLYPIIKKQ